MKCPICSVELKLAERQGVEIDYCPQCRGVWLDRGELDKLIERSVVVQSQSHPGEYDERDEYREARTRHGGSHSHGEPYKRKRRSFLEDIFDF
jgi:Zn-finger nucleic acid-binding protein